MKHATRDARYLSLRRTLADAVGPVPLWPTVDAWPLYAGIQNIARNFTLGGALYRTLTIPGDVLEFGAWRGATTLLFAKLLHLIQPHGPKIVHAFDLWGIGFQPDAWTPADNAEVAQRYQGTYSGSMEVIYDMLELYELSDAVVLHRGPISETWPKLKEQTPGLRVSMALLDVDLYEPTAAALVGLHERLSVGGVLVFDEYGHPDWPGETQAADEFFTAHPGCYQIESPSLTPQPSLVATKVEA